MRSAAVAIITRTQDRPLTLDRTIRDILGQTFSDWQWVLVSDGGNLPVIKQVVARYASQLVDRLILVERPKSQSGGATSNAGIEASDSRYIVLHDDDDTWHPDFLRKTVDFLQSAGPRGHGVVTGSQMIFEVLQNNHLLETSRKSMPLPADPVDPAALRRSNPFPPIAFLYDRAASAEIGHYRTTIPLLTDWEFNVRFVDRFGIGVIPATLAYWHRRKLTAGASRTYANYSYRRNLDVLMQLKREWGMLPPVWRYLLLWRY